MYGFILKEGKINADQRLLGLELVSLETKGIMRSF